MQPLGRNFWIEQTAKQPAHSAANQIGNRGGDIQCPILQIDKQGDSAEKIYIMQMAVGKTVRSSK